MRNFKKFAAMASAIVLAACAVAPMASFNVSATDVYVNVSDDLEEHTYIASEIFKGTFNDLGLTITGWGEDINVNTLIADNNWKNFVVKDAVEEDVENGITASPAVTIGEIANTSEGAAAAAQKLELVGSDTAKADALARVIANHLNKVDGVVSGTVLSKDSNNKTVLSGGYYIITDSYANSDSDGASSDAISKYILKVAGNDEISINPKKDKPTVAKKVYENQVENAADTAYSAGGEKDKQWNDVADYSIGDEISFKLYGTLPENLNDYVNGYKYVFHDTVDSQFDLVGSDGNVEVVVMIGKDTIDSSKYTVSTSGKSFTVSFDNLLNAGVTIDDPANTLVTVEYKAKLNAAANIGKTGQENTVYLEYANNPNWDGTGTPTTDETPRDEVVVFTYEIDSTKVDGATNATLSGAEFVLKNEAGKFALINNIGIFQGWSDTQVNDVNEAGLCTKLISDTNGKFIVKGLDEGKYYIHETKAPEGYNDLTADIEIVVTATTANNQSYAGTPENALTGFKFKYGAADEVVQADNEITGIASGVIENNKGTSLPGTGGIGTTIFYVGGGAMVALAGVFLITKKRMGKKEN